MLFIVKKNACFTVSCCRSKIVICITSTPNQKIFELVQRMLKEQKGSEINTKLIRGSSYDVVLRFKIFLDLAHYS